MSPVGTAEGVSRPYGTKSWGATFPSNKLLGYFQVVPPGRIGAANPVESVMHPLFRAAGLTDRPAGN